MDFTFTEDQTTVSSLAGELFRDHCTSEALRANEDSDEPGFDRALWAKLAESGLLGVALPESAGGLGLTVLEAGVLINEAGKYAAAVPLLAHTISATALARAGADLTGLADGSRLVAPALVEPLGDELVPSTTATDGLLTGTKTCVPAGLYADAYLVSASTKVGPKVFLVERADVTVERQDTITYRPEALVALDGAPGTLVGDLDDVVQVATVLVAAHQLGTAEEATRLTAEYTKTREQFGHPIAHFQAVGQRAADCFIDTTTIRLTVLQASWLLAQGLPADKAVAVAKYFASDAGQRVVRAAAHLHGGMGVSREYPLHRYYVAAKHNELTLGSGTRQLLRLGKLLAEEPV
ncbi:MAG: acyl-CoA dehydrogenase protein [Frankiales bacterium]|nr:acyl-CoA dehydrogenase protein [Frankiales bacterium]